MMIRAALLLLLITAATARAIDMTVTLVPDSGNAKVIGWKDAKAMKEGHALLEAGINKAKAELLMGLVACLADPGTKVRTRGSRANRRRWFGPSANPLGELNNSSTIGAARGAVAPSLRTALTA